MFLPTGPTERPNQHDQSGLGRPCWDDGARGSTAARRRRRATRYGHGAPCRDEPHDAKSALPGRWLSSDASTAHATYGTCELNPYLYNTQTPANYISKCIIITFLSAAD